MNEVLKIGLVGTGVALRTHLPAFRRTGKAEIAALVGSSLDRAASFASEFDIPRVYPDVQALCAGENLDLIVIASPNNQHYPQIKHALQAGVNILAEKPLGMVLPEVVELARLAAQSPGFALIDHQLRFNPYMEAIRNLIRSGDLGRLYFVRFHFQGGHADPARAFNWHYDADQGGGVRMAMASHLTDLLWFWTGLRKVYAVHGRMDSIVPQRPDQEGILRDVKTAGFFTAHLSMEDNLEVQMSDTSAIGESAFTAALYGTKGELYFDVQDGLCGAYLGDQGLKEINIDLTALDAARQEGSIFRKSFDVFAAKIAASILMKNDSLLAQAARFSDAVSTQRILDAIRESTLLGRDIQLDEGYRPGALF